CTGGTPTRQSFTTGVGTGSCGHLDADGNPGFFPLACGGLYFGGAGVSTPLPSTIPDLGTTVTNVSCNGTALTLSGTTPADTGGNRCSGGTNHHNACASNADCSGGACKFLTCSNAGCLFGPPLPVPNGSHSGAATSTCVINTVAADGAGAGAHCRTFIQPCPICDPTTNTCDGGPNNGLTCTPGASPVDGDFPTSHDCPPATSLGIGTLSIGFKLDTGTITQTAVDTADQVNVFCGFCKNKTLNSFARKCDGAATGANCTGDGNCPAGQHCLPIACNPANGNADCAAATGFASCGQR